MIEPLAYMDNRIDDLKSVKSIYSVSDVAIGDIGFFSDVLSSFDDLDKTPFGIVTYIKYGSEHCFINNDSDCCRYFLPLEELSHEDQRSFIEKHPSLFAKKQEETETEEEETGDNEDTSKNQQSLLTIDKIENDGNGLLVHATVNDKKALQDLVNILYLID